MLNVPQQTQYRIQVAVRNGWGRRWNRYRVILRDTAQYGPKSVLDHCRFSGSEFAGWFLGDNQNSGLLESEETSQARAIALAKRLAKEYHLPFDQQEDMIPIEWIERSGPLRECRACGKEAYHPNPEYVCPTCLANAKWLLSSDRVRVLSQTQPDDVFPYRIFPDGETVWEDSRSKRINDKRVEYGGELLRLLAAFVEQKVSEAHTYPRDSLAPTGGNTSMRTTYGMSLSMEQVAAGKALINFIRQLVTEAHANGVGKADNLLVGLADGTFTVDGFNEQVRKGVKR